MNKSSLKKLIRETVYNLLEEDTKFSEGERVIDNKGKTGIISLSKHPFYAVKLDSTGTTHSYHFTDLMKNEDIDGDGYNDYGKYDTTPEPEEPLQESSPSEIIIMNGLLNVQDDLNVLDVLSDIRSISGVTIVRPIDIPGESHKSKLVIKIDPFPFKGKSEDGIKEFIKTSIRKIPGTKEFFTNAPVSTNEIRFRVIENKFITTKRSLMSKRLNEECSKLNESDSISYQDTEVFCELANPDMAHPYEENISNHWSFEDKYGNKLEVSFDPSTTYIESYFVLKDKEGKWIKAYDYDKVRWNIAPEFQLVGGTDEGRSDTVCKIIRDEIIPKYLLNKKPQYIKLHPLNDYRYRVFKKCAQVCQEKYPEIQIKEMGPEIYLINK